MKLPLRTPKEIEVSEHERAIVDAMWSGDADKLHELAGCICCCDEHTAGRACPAWKWGGCRGGSDVSPPYWEEERAWLAHYQVHHGMSEKEFYGFQD